jgi:hypothetical protein
MKKNNCFWSLLTMLAHRKRINDWIVKSMRAVINTLFLKTTFPWGRGPWEDKTIRGRCYNAFITSVISLVSWCNAFEFDCEWSFEEAKLSIRIWNEMLVSKQNFGCKKCEITSYRKKLNSMTFSKRRWELMTCHLFLTSFHEIYDHSNFSKG